MITVDLRKAEMGSTPESSVNPIATVVITTRDRPGLVNRAIRSALDQSLHEIEVIVVDDGSIQPLETSEQDARLRLIRQDYPRGVCTSRNVGLTHANGRWITFLDDDDQLLPHMLETSVQAAGESQLPPPVAVLSAIEVVGLDGAGIDILHPVTSRQGRHFFLEGSPNGVFRATNALVAPTEIVRWIGGWDESILASERADFFLRLNLVCSLQGLPVVTYQKMSLLGERLAYDWLANADGMKLTAKKHRRIFSRHPKRSAHFLGSMGILYLKAGKWGPALSATSRAVLLDPTRAKLYRWWLASMAGPRGLRLYRHGFGSEGKAR